MKLERDDIRAVNMDEYNRRSPLDLSKRKVWFLNGSLVRKHKHKRHEGILILFNITEDCFEQVLVDDWIRLRRRAFTVTEAAYILNRHPKSLPRMAKNGKIPPPMGASRDGVRGLGIRSYYSEDEIYDIRAALASQPCASRLPTIQEARHKMGDEILHYTKDSEGRIVPIWNETV